MLSREALTKFQELWKQEKGEDLSDDIAMEEATKLLTLFDVIYRPIKFADVVNDPANSLGKAVKL